MLKLFNKNLGQLEKKTFRLHFIYSIIEGIIVGVLALNEFVFVKSLKGSDISVGLLFQFSVFVLTFSVLLNEWSKRIKNQKRFIITVGLITRLPLFLLFLFPDNVGHMGSNKVYHLFFILIFLTYYLANPIIFPIINQLLKSSYRHEKFSQLYSYSTIANKIVMMLVTLLYGILLDHNENAYRYVFPVISILGICSVWLLSGIKSTEDLNIIPSLPLWQSVKRSIKNMRSKMKINKPFRDFEAAFMFYGFAFMGTVSVITIYFEKGLGLNYSSVAFYKNSYNLLAIILLPLFGRLMGKIDPRKFSAITFASLLFYLLFIALTTVFPYFSDIEGIRIYYTLFIAMLFNGVFAATMSLLWSIGSVYFCKTEEASEYQSIHLTFTGLRSFFAPLLGVWIYWLVGFTATFLTGVVLLAIAVGISLKSQKKYSL